MNFPPPPLPPPLPTLATDRLAKHAKLIVTGFVLILLMSLLVFILVLLRVQSQTQQTAAVVDQTDLMETATVSVEDIVESTFSSTDADAEEAGNRDIDAGSQSSVGGEEGTGGLIENQSNEGQVVIQEQIDISESQEISKTPDVSGDAGSSAKEPTSEIKTRKLMLGVAQEATAPVATSPVGGGSAGTVAEFSKRVEREGGRSGDLQVTLIWNNLNDLDLHVFCPSGEEIFFSHPNSQCGGVLDVDMNAGGHMSREPVENVVWSRRQPASGRYVVGVEHYATHGGRNPTSFQVLVKQGGTTRKYRGVLDQRQHKRVALFAVP